MRKIGILGMAAAGAALLAVACSDVPTTTPAIEEVGTQLGAKGGKPGGGGGGGGATDPTAVFTLAASEPDATGLFGDGFGAYENGKCGVLSEVFATTAGSGSGDAILDTSGKDRKCKHSPRRVTLVFADSIGNVTTEQVTVRVNVHEVQSPTSVIHLGFTETRGMNVNPWSGSRCDNIHFKENLDGTTGEATGANSVQVTRVDERTWRVWNRAGDKALCASAAGNELVELPVDFTIVASVELPAE